MFTRSGIMDSSACSIASYQNIGKGRLTCSQSRNPGHEFLKLFPLGLLQLRIPCFQAAHMCADERGLSRQLGLYKAGQ